MPTGTVVASQGTTPEQLKTVNKRWGCWKAKLYQLEVEKKEQKAAALRREQMEIGWGSQIRSSYVFHPYSMVKDHRNQWETGNVQAVMDGRVRPISSMAI